MNHEPNTPHSMRSLTPVLLTTNTARFTLGKHQSGNFGCIGIYQRSANTQAMAKNSQILGIFRLIDETALHAMTPDEQRHAPTVMISTNGCRTVTMVLTQQDI